MIFANKLNSTCVHRKRLGADAYGDSAFAEGAVIRCRREDVNRLVLDQNSREAVSSARFFLADKAEPGDTLDGKIVISVSALTGMFGKAEGFEANCV
ncbi:MAG: hypothetical protein FWE20_10905 [Defluviitaleaceae bacterium]|nr:hypothetical protein [Defluviitaleaceae bacterium]